MIKALKDCGFKLASSARRATFALVKMQFAKKSCIIGILGDTINIVLSGKGVRMAKNVTLELKCVYCGESLMDASHPVDGFSGIKIMAHTPEDSGIVWFSSIFGSPNADSEIVFQPKAVARFSCPHCATDLTTKQKCDLCRADMVSFRLAEGGQVKICSRRGCKHVWLDLY
jgi:hypothetical protein